MKAYKLFDLLTNSIFFSQDVTFHETIFLFQKIPSPPALPLPLPSFDCASSSYQPQTFASSPCVVTPSLPYSIPLSSSPSSHPPRRSDRVHNRPILLQDFVSACSTPPSPSLPLSDNISSESKPTSYHQACHPLAWVHAMQQELKALETNQT